MTTMDPNVPETIEDALAEVIRQAKEAGFTKEDIESAVEVTLYALKDED